MKRKNLSFMKSTFIRQQNSDIFSTNDPAAHFKNRYSSHICFVDDDANKGGLPEPSPTSSGTLTDEQLQQIVAAVNAQKSPESQEPKPAPLNNSALTQEQINQIVSAISGNSQRDDISTKHKGEKKSLEDQQKQQQEIESAAQFDAQFDSFLKDNHRFFKDGITAQYIRNGVNEWAQGKSIFEKTQGMAAAAAKSFFDNPENLKALDESDRLIAQQKIVDISERNIERDVAWPLISRAIFNLKRLEEYGNYRANSTSNQSSGFKHVDAYNNRFFPKQENK